MQHKKGKNVSKSCVPTEPGTTWTQKTSPPGLAHTASRSGRSLQLKDEAPQQQTQDFHSHPYLTQPVGTASTEPCGVGKHQSFCPGPLHPPHLHTASPRSSTGHQRFWEGSTTPPSPHPSQKVHTRRGAHRPSLLPLQGNPCPHGQTITFACRGRW